MGLIKRADIEQYTRDALVLDLHDLEKRGQAVIEAANAQANQILRDAHAQRDQLISSATNDGRDQGYKEGFEQGLAEGVAKGIEEARAAQAQLLDQLSQMWIAQLDGFEQQRDTMLEQARTQIVELGAQIAQRVTRRVIELDPSVVLNEMEAILSSMTESTRLVLAVHPGDIELAQAQLPKMIERFAACEHAQVVTDPSLEPGSCVARTPSGGIIDASITTQLDRIISALLPTGEDVGEAGQIKPEDSQMLESAQDSIDDLPKGDAA